MKHYLELLEKVKNEGIQRDDRTGVGTRGIFGEQLRFDLSDGFPLLTTKKVFLRGIIYELLWFLKGDTNIKYLVDNGVHIWDEWADKNGDLGRIYGSLWRDFKDSAYNGKGRDQITELIHNLKTNPYSRRHIVTAWNPTVVPDTTKSFAENIKNNKAVLPPCHTLFQFYVTPPQNGEKAKLSCQLYQRSADIFLGVPFNIASYSLLTMMIAQVCDLDLGDFVHTFGDVHIYNNHIKQVNEQLSRTPTQKPIMKINPKVKDIFEFRYEDFELCNYNPQGKISAPVAI